ncbi:MAG: UDP-2,3-diacylglucosamine hydrolase [Candidatus Thiodiazotropha sp. (ex Monitilora ramsayi)]|nr:UDP-2,3-diacylglucosamine hydrolase [Candidatus Thiodiazotropha sp. (ex Monitilora ramsayi)]
MCRRVINRFLALTVFIVLSLTILPLHALEVEAGLLVYRVVAPDDEAYMNRLLVTADYVRLDQGEQDPGFILFDRREQVIYSVNATERSILVIDPAEKNKQHLPDDLTLEIRSNKNHEAPEIAGIKPQHWQLITNGAICREAFVLPSTMTEVISAYGEYLGVLAAQQAVALATLPNEFRDACDSVVHAYAPDAFIQKGLPVKIWNDQGYDEALVDFQASFKISAEHFSLPEDYQQVPMGIGG